MASGKHFVLLHYAAPLYHAIAIEGKYELLSWGCWHGWVKALPMRGGGVWGTHARAKKTQYTIVHMQMFQENMS